MPGALSVAARLRISRAMLVGAFVSSGFLLHDARTADDAVAHRNQIEALSKLRVEYSMWALGVRKVDGRTAADPTAGWFNQVRGALEQAGTEIAAELDEDLLPAIDPLGDPLVRPQLDARRARLIRYTGLRVPYFLGDADLLRALREEMEHADPPSPELIARAHRYAEEVDHALNECMAREREFRAAQPRPVTPNLAAWHAAQGDPSQLPAARREHEQVDLPMHLAAVRLFQVHDAFVQEVHDLLPEDRRMTWRHRAALELLRPYHDYYKVSALRSRIDASSVIPDQSKEEISNLMSTQAPVRAALVERLNGLQRSLMTEAGVREWWANEFEWTVAAIMKSPEPPPRVPPAWQAAMDELLMHDADTRNRVQKILTPEQWQAVRR